MKDEFTTLMHADMLGWSKEDSHMLRYLEAWIRQKSVESMDSLSSIMMLILKKLKEDAYDNTTSKRVFQLF